MRIKPKFSLEIKYFGTLALIFIGMIVFSIVAQNKINLNKCKYKANMMQKEYIYNDYGCLIKMKNGWFPIENVRISE